MSYLTDLFKGKDKKALSSLGLLLATGVVLLLSSNLLFGKTKTSEPEPPLDGLQTTFLQNQAEEKSTQEQKASVGSYESEMEKRLADVFSSVDGAGKVKVMITLSQGKELVLAKDFTYETETTEENDAQGGSREVSSQKQEETKILYNDGNGQRPLVITETSPKVEGIIIIAEGGEDIYVKDALTRAAQVILGIDINRVQVLKMK